MPRSGAPLPEDLRDILHPWSDGMFQCGNHTFRTLEGAYQAHRAAVFHPGYENLSGGQAWARGARRRIPHRAIALRVAVEARYADLEAFRGAVLGHTGPFKIWHQERSIGQQLEIIYGQLRRGSRSKQVPLSGDSPPWSKQP